MSVAVVMIWVGWSNRHGLAGATDTVEEIVDDFAPGGVTDPAEPT